MNRRKLITTASAAGALALAGGGAWWYFREDDAPKGASDVINLLAGGYTEAPHQSDPTLFADLTLTGGMPTNTRMEVRLYDVDSSPIIEVGELSGSLLNLVSGESQEQLEITAQDDGSWLLEQDSVESEGWWQVKLQVDGATVSWTFLMPDPNLTGMETPPTDIDSDPDASAMLVAALDTLSNRTSLRWWEWLSGGNGSIVLATFSVTTEESNGLPATFESDAVMAGRIDPDTFEASFREENRRTISTEAGAEMSVNGGTPEPANVIRYLPIDQYYTTYEGHQGVHFGTTAEIQGRDCQLVAFYLPSAVPAWFAFWIDIETLMVHELFMLSVNHYMHWIYYDVDEPFELEFDQ